MAKICSLVTLFSISRHAYGAYFAVMFHFDPNNRRRQQANATVTYLWIRANLW